MTTTDWTNVGLRLLGAYFIAGSVLTVASLPNTWILAATTAGVSAARVVGAYGLSALVEAVVGFVLIRRSLSHEDPARSSAALSIDTLMPAALQIIGVTILVDGVSGAVRNVGEIIAFDSDWRFRGSSLFAAATAAALGAYLIVKPSVVASRLRHWRGPV